MITRSEQLSVSAVRKTNTPALTARLRRGCSILALMAPLLWPASAWAADVVMPALGDSVYNPTTAASETVTRLITPAAVVTNNGYLIFIANKVGDTYVDPTTGNLMQVVSVTTDSGGFVTSVGVQDTTLSSPPTITQDIATFIPLDPGNSANGNGSGISTITPPAGNHNIVYNVQYGKDGKNGHDGGGLKIFGVCLCYGPAKGGNGAAGPNITTTIATGDGPITSVSDSLPGITIKSVGGDGGRGGDAYGNIDGAAGGSGGAGGTVTVTNHANVTTSGTDAFGMLIQSSSGKGGKGGNGYILGDGGSGGTAGQGGNVSLVNDGTIITTGNGAIAILAQSLGGSSGNGGSSYGIVAKAGDSKVGGNGGAVNVTQAGLIQTSGQDAHGLLAQSVGGDGGNSGNAGGLLGESSGGGSGGNGGIVTITGTSGSRIVTTGSGSVGLFGQSVGGGGGNGGFSAGVVALGSSGGGGGNGSAVSINLASGASISTGGVFAGIRFGDSSHGIFAQSVGGGGGSAGIAGGLVALGSSGDHGGNGGAVTVDTEGVIVTGGQDAKGVFAQSVGGGGGAAQGTGGLVSLGGSGGGGGVGGSVSALQRAGGSITTGGLGADAIFAQSVGGGGGAGSASGGLVSLGGSGSGGGNGGTVSVENYGTLTTSGALARGIFAQSVGGGGGAGGDSGGLVSLGGSGSVASNGGAVTVTNLGSILTGGNRSAGLQAQSIGGGGGDGGTSGGAFFTLGGKGGVGGDAGVVTVNDSGVITTTGADAHALFAQSVGGGGGNGGASYSGAPFAGVAIGGSGALGGKGGEVDIHLTQSTVSGSTTLVDPVFTTTGDRSDGIFAQSVGGGGGNGGLAVQGSIGAFGSVSVAIGGKGGAGGAGGLVNLDGHAAISTEGANAFGLMAQSVGGGGGNGGGAISVSISGGYGVSASISAAVGGAGGDGGAGGIVNVDSGGQIYTGGDFSTGFVAQSVGGGGGSGGYAISLAGAGSNGVALSVGIGLGGKGGKGGAGGKVDGVFDGWIWTDGDNAGGAVIQSVGGGGGAGGFDITASFAGAGSVAPAASAGFGGSGGDGGIGGQVNGRIGGDVATWGDLSNGIVIQSVGGGGGAGGFNIAGSIGAAGEAGFGLSVGFGGSGGGGGKGGQVVGESDGEIITTGSQSSGLIVQSVGGGGGAGGFNVSGSVGGGGEAGVAGSIGFGGVGGGGGDGGFVTGKALERVQTFGFASSGVVIQSVGGGGGTGAFNISGTLGVAQSAGGAISVGLGGAGGDGGEGGQVIAYGTDVSTAGDLSVGFLAQSVGGGGGNGGFNVSGGLGGGGSFGGVATVGLGGFGGGGGDSSTVDATFEGDALTEGFGSNGIVAQSLGGGGGNGAFNVSGGLSASQDAAVTVGVGLGGFGGDGGHSGAVALTVTGHSNTLGAHSDAVLAQSVGGGGGAGAFNITGGLSASTGSFAGTVGVSIGGFGGGGGDGDAVTFNMNQAAAGSVDAVVVSTAGHDSVGVLVQSVGGGGGAGGFSVDGSLSVSETGAGNIGVGIGGGGGDGGNGAAVIANLNGAILTEGENSAAFVAQSVGGGGGTGGFNVSGGIAASTDVGGNLMVGIGGFGGDGGDSGAVSGTVFGNIATLGAMASGLTYQSLGGAGGSGGFDVTGGISIVGGDTGAGTIGLGVGGFGGGGGSSSTVDATYTGDISTMGRGSYGAMLQSAAGGGGTGGFNVTGGLAFSTGLTGVLGVGIGGFGGGGGSSDDVTGALTGNVTTLGDEAFGAVLQSLGGAGGNGGINVTGGMALSVGDSAASGVIGIGLGGFGGHGGSAGDVTGTVTGLYQTSGASALGVMAQSVGGGGGIGAIDVTGNIAASFGETGTLSIGLGVGGFGGDGGNAGSVDLTRVGDTFTSGMKSDGVTAMSIGGAGGHGGLNVTGGLNITNANTSLGFSLGLGGFGGGGGNSGDVTLAVVGNVKATGAGARMSALDEAGNTVMSIADGSNGVVAQSIGGGGGNGAINVSGQLSIASPSSNAGFAASIGVGGFGGSGGDAGTVTASVLPPGSSIIDVIATGDNMSAVMAQSIGGGGGSGGINIAAGLSLSGSLAMGVGGFGGDGGLGKDVSATVEANLWASGQNSNGLLAQSIGGGGGAGGINVSGAVSGWTQSQAPSISFGVGGFGGTGNASGDVTVDQFGQIVVEGQNSFGILAQSIGGGGGNGGLNVSASLNNSKQEEGFAIAVGIGGSGGTGANSGSVDLTSAGNVFVNAVGTTTDEGTTYANEPYLDFNGGGVVAQSIAGGGGNGGINATGAIAPFGNPIALGVGGSGGDGGDAGAVTVHRGFDLTNSGLVVDPASIIVRGDSTPGLVAQSIGGGGGTAGMNFVIAATLAPKGDDTVAAQVVIGGGGGDAGNGNTVDVTQNGDISTAGAGSIGLVASSIGGGGGNANYSIGFGATRKANALDIAVGGGAGAAGSAAAVTVDQTGTISTNGVGSFGLLAQSIGGGGGNTALTISMSLSAKNQLSIGIGRHGGTGGTGSDVTVRQNGVITTEGDLSSAIAAESIGGGGGTSSATTIGVTIQGGEGDKKDSYQGSVSIGLDGGIAAISGNVSVTSIGVLSTFGEYSQGILAQSIGGGGGVGGDASNTLFNNAGGAVVAVGGHGGSGAKAGTVTIDTSSFIVTKGDQSEGVLAQSIGGGGGRGGSTRTLNIEFGLPKVGGTNSTENTIAVNVGGVGGSGGDAGAVTVNNTGVIETAGARSYGMRAQSIGGGGGDGGAVLNLRLQANDKQDSNSMSLNIGGEGGTGGIGSTVDVVNTGYIYTTGLNAAGVVAQSVGGGGGDGGLVLDISGGLPGSSSTTNSLLMDIGGSGGIGGTGGDVTITNHRTNAAESGIIVTTGDNAYGILGQSIGGGGGNGSSIIQATAYYSGKNSITAGLAIGGAGGSGNTGGAVTVTNDGLIQTGGAGAHGIVAQSVGGGGGNGGMAIAANVTYNATDSTPLLAIGGSGGDGGNGGTVLVNNIGSILTTGENANGILAQSIGGGGGNANVGFSLTGEMNSLLLSNTFAAVIGALTGGSGGTGGAVTVNHSGDITVEGQGSQAIVAQSINGGGGTLTLDVSGIVGLPGIPYINSGVTITPMPEVTALLGGSGNVDMGSGKVTVNASGTFGASGGNGAAGLLQAIGGGGGTYNLKLGLLPSSSDPNITTEAVAVPVDVALGGIGGSNNAGGDVTGGYTGSLSTSGTNSPAQLVQSIGGGGGRAVLDITVPEGSLLGQIALALGGRDGQNEAGGVIDFTQSGALATSGALSPGAMLQSIGGGGGTASISLQGAGAASAMLNESLGSSGGSGLGGGAITALFSGGISTTGANSLGLFAQSIGAGGGEIRMAGVVSYNVAFGGTNGASGSGGAITITNNGAIHTSGAGSHGVFLQSVGGGGGAVFGDPITVTLNTANSGDGAAVHFTQHGDIVTTGAGANGIVVQSIGGGGGWIDGLFFGTAGGSGTGGIVNISTTGNVLAVGADATAIFAESEGGSGQSNITVDVLNPAGGKALVLGGLGANGAGVKLVGGVDNVLNNAGVIGTAATFTGPVLAVSADDGTVTVLGTNARTTTLGGTTGYAVVALGGANTTINNTGVMMGSVDLGMVGHNVFNNQLGAVFNSGANVVLGSGNVLANAGTLSPGGFNRIATTAITGNLAQASSAKYGLDVDLRADTTDQITVSGNAAVSGVVHANLVDPLVAPAYALPGTHTRLILSATGGATHSGLTLQAFNTAVANYALTYPDTNKIDLQYVIDYSPSGLTGNQHAMGDAVNAIQTKQGSDMFRPIAVNLFYLPDMATLGAAYDSLSGEGVAALQQASFDSSDQFLTVVGNQVGEWLDMTRSAAQGWRLWLSPYGTAAMYGGDADRGAAKVKQSAYGIAGGFDYQISENALVGIGIGGGETWINVPSRLTKASTDNLHFGAYGSMHDEDWYVSGAISYDIYKNVESRVAVIPGVTLPKPQFVDGAYIVPGYYENPTAKFNSSGYSGRLEAGYIYDLGGVSATPFAGLEFASLTTDAFKETNAGLPSQIGRFFGKDAAQSLPSLLGVKFDASTNIGSESVLSGWVRGGWKHEFAITRTADGEFIMAPGLGFKVHGAEPAREAAFVDTGLRFKVDNSVTIYTNYNGTYGGPNASYAGSAGVSIRW